jgi:hypothetical protein
MGFLRRLTAASVAASHVDDQRQELTKLLGERPSRLDTKCPDRLVKGLISESGLGDQIAKVGERLILLLDAQRVFGDALGA